MRPPQNNLPTYVFELLCEMWDPEPKNRPNMEYVLYKILNFIEISEGKIEKEKRLSLSEIIEDLISEKNRIVYHNKLKDINQFVGKNDNNNDYDNNNEMNEINNDIHINNDVVISVV